MAPLIVIIGQTASGKSDLALDIAKSFNGEIICADSRTIYKGMNIGTAKPGKKALTVIQHHLLDIIEPDQTFTAADFKQLAVKAINNIDSRGKLPILVGGTGLYIDGVIFDYAFMPPVETEEREQLQQLSVEQLQQKLAAQGIGLPENKANPRHLIRALETNGAVPVKGKFRSNTLMIGIEKSKEELIKNIEVRTADMIVNGLEAEVKQLAEHYGWQSPGMNAVGYKEWHEYESPVNVERAINQNSLHYAKRQRTWFKRNPNINWVKNSVEALRLVKTFIQHN
ncbi:MAG: tRNA (adenosine(37)-N6)-dimethylallyltransferase MiaA [bacterium]|nr:tRNA (adenosine(37)-N6)-dimethylallyltransferase MiaA [bacterium]